MNDPSLLQEYWTFLKTRKRFWLLPLLALLILAGILIVMVTMTTQTSPFIYALF